MIKSVGTLAYGPGNRVVLLAEQDIAEFYFSLVPKWVGLKRQAYPAHVSVVRKETPPDMGVWRKHDGKTIPFEYLEQIENDETYYWLPVRSEGLVVVRRELGLPPWPPWRNKYHLTIGNLKS